MSTDVIKLLQEKAQKQDQVNKELRDLANAQLQVINNLAVALDATIGALKANGIEVELPDGIRRDQTSVD